MGTIEQKKYKKEFYVEGECFVDCVFEGCDLSAKDLSKIQFQSCQFIFCNLVTTKMTNTRLQGVSFIESKLMGVDFTRCDPTFFDVSFNKCLLRGCNFTEMRLKGLKILESTVKDCHFVQCILERSDFRKCDLEGTVFHHTKLCYANFLEAFHFEIDPLNNDLKGAKFSKVEALSLLNGLGIIIE